ncbi:23S rRNA pseudouridine(1911/1915/1917) synthase RluD [Catenovulum maritimum]|uniref:Pseudouridine synthase n=1 Tax=Catenovulum maritimum TaxID=1513271 RepID=A0A0J8JML3_9ALTE|nr:23S rRNA pseudouridine(1911/1915/1917) synthase RluD [Catenovulum maritimum]KMT65851.1 23S rRNA pseudouridylate synthase [Catenovulum maritimum]
MLEHISLSGTIAEHSTGHRLDQALSDLFPEYSRSRIKEWLLAGHIKINGEVATKPREKVYGGEQVEIEAEITVEVEAQAQNIALDIVYEDDDIIVINKPMDLVVHPGAGNKDGTILNALLHHYPEIEQVPRAGIVHRLDKDTTGLMVVAKNLIAQTSLVSQLQDKTVTREYEAIVLGNLTAGGLIDEPIGRHPTKRILQAVVADGKPAVTHYRVAEKYRAHTRIRLRLETGRTHQIRVHMSNMKHPLVGDLIYGGKARPPKGASEELREALRQFRRQALHAVILELEHPATGEWMQFEAPVPEDMVKIAEILRQDTREHGLNEL